MKKYFSLLLGMSLVFVLSFVALSSVNTARAVYTSCTSAIGWDSINSVPCAVVSLPRAGESSQVVNNKFLPKVNYKPSTLTKTTIVKRGVSDQSTVTLLQAYLLNQGFVPQGDSLDGITGSKTVAAIMEFQKATKGALSVDGKVGADTWAYIAIAQGVQLKSADDRTLEALKARFNEFYKGVPKAERVTYNARRVLTQVLTVPASVRALAPSAVTTTSVLNTTTATGLLKKIKTVNKNYTCVSTSTNGKYCKFISDEDALAIKNGTKTAEQVLLGKAPTAGSCLRCYCVIPENVNDPVCQTLVLTEGDGSAGSCGPGSGGNYWIQGTPVPHNEECIPRATSLTAALTYDNVFTAYTYKTNASGVITSLKPFCSDMNWNQTTGTAMNVHKGWKSPEACSTSIEPDDAGIAVAGYDDHWIAQSFLGVVTMGGVQYPTGDAHWQRMKSDIPGPVHPAGFSPAVVIEQMNKGIWGDSLDVGENGMAPWGVIPGDGLASARWLQVEDPGWKNFGIHRLKFCPTPPEDPDPAVEGTYVIGDLSQITHMRKTYTASPLSVEVRVKINKPAYIIGSPALRLVSFQGSSGLGVIMEYNASASTATELVFSHTDTPTDGFTPAQYSLTSYESLNPVTTPGNTIHTLSPSGLIYYPNNFVWNPPTPYPTY